jgi:hypothetical protein
VLPTTSPKIDARDVVAQERPGDPYLRRSSLLVTSFQLGPALAD